MRVSGLMGMTAVAGGIMHSLALKGDCSVWAWGNNGDSQLGDGTHGNYRTTPVQTFGLTGASAISAGGFHSLFLSSGPGPAPTVLGTWPANGTVECGVGRLVVVFSKPVLNVSTDDVSLSTGVVISMTGSGDGPYMFNVGGWLGESVTVTLGGDITDELGQALTPYTFNFSAMQGPPYIVSQPMRQDAFLGGSASFHVLAISAMSYQWCKGSENLSDGGRISGTSTPTLTINLIEPGDAGEYYVVITSPCGSVTSAPTTLAVWHCGDINRDGTVGEADYWLFVGACGRCVGDPAYNAAADLDHDGCVTLVDYQIWLQCYRGFIGDPFALPPVPGHRGDLNGDGVVNVSDIELLVAVLLGDASDVAHAVTADMDGSGAADGLDIQPFVNALLDQ
jgi:hypothetical protein